MNGQDAQGLLRVIFDQEPDGVQKDAAITLIGGLFDLLNDIRFYLQNADERTSPHR